MKKLLLYPLIVISIFLAFLLALSYFCFGLFILDGIYFLFTGTTIVYKYLNIDENDKN